MIVLGCLSTCRIFHATFVLTLRLEMADISETSSGQSSSSSQNRRKRKNDDYEELGLPVNASEHGEWQKRRAHWEQFTRVDLNPVRCDGLQINEFTGAFKQHFTI